jgi:uncharacterized protein (DUF1810 family)
VTGDPYNLQRFIDAQAHGFYEQALAELREGQKRSHWMWFIFPQHVDLGRSPTANFYGLHGTDEAVAYLGHPILGKRLRECCKAILPHLSKTTAEAILGPIDAMKLGSAMEIFASADPKEPLFAAVRKAIR